MKNLLSGWLLIVLLACTPAAAQTVSTNAGNVNGPASATSGHVATFNGTSGKLLQDGGVPGTVTSVSCGAGLAGGTITTTGTCTLGQSSITWTPGISFGGTPATASVALGAYTETGGMLVLVGRINLSAKNGTGNAQLTGLPLTVHDQKYEGCSLTLYDSMVAITGAISIVMDGAGQSTGTFQLGGATTQSTMTDTNFNNNSSIGVICIYEH